MNFLSSPGAGVVPEPLSVIILIIRAILLSQLPVSWRLAKGELKSINFNHPSRNNSIVDSNWTEHTRWLENVVSSNNNSIELVTRWCNSLGRRRFKSRDTTCLCWICAEFRDVFSNILHLIHKPMISPRRDKSLICVLNSVMFSEGCISEQGDHPGLSKVYMKIWKYGHWKSLHKH